MKKLTFLSAITASVILLAPAASQARDYYHPSHERESHGRYEGNRGSCDSGRGYDYRGSRGGYDPRYDGNRGSCDSGRDYQQVPSHGGHSHGGYSHGSNQGGFRGPIFLPGFLSGLFGGQRSCR